MKIFGKVFGSIFISGCMILGSVASVLASGVEAGKGDGRIFPPTAEQKKLDLQKSKEADEYCKKKTENEQKSISTRAEGIYPNGDRKNPVGLFRQTENFTCGPSAARNLINGYVYFNYTKQGKQGFVPTEETLKTELGTQKGSGTDFTTSKWQTVLKKYTDGRTYTTSWGLAQGWEASLRSKIMKTIDDPKAYNVIANINHGKTSTPIDPAYALKGEHYVCVYGYNDTSKVFWIADSNSKAPSQYYCSYKALANSTQKRGVIW